MALYRRRLLKTNLPAGLSLTLYSGSRLDVLEEGLFVLISVNIRKRNIMVINPIITLPVSPIRMRRTKANISFADGPSSRIIEDPIAFRRDARKPRNTNSRQLATFELFIAGFRKFAQSRINNAITADAEPIIIIAISSNTNGEVPVVMKKARLCPITKPKKALYPKYHTIKTRTKCGRYKMLARNGDPGAIRVSTGMTIKNQNKYKMLMSKKGTDVHSGILFSGDILCIYTLLFCNIILGYWLHVQDDFDEISVLKVLGSKFFSVPAC